MSKFDIKKYLFYDIETHRVAEFNEISDNLQKAFINHYYDSLSYSSPEEQYRQISALHPEFSHVICISFGYEDSEGNYQKFHICDLDEVKLLNQCTIIFDKFMKAGFSLAGHNILSCDNPYMAKRYIINKIQVPEMLNNIGKKPWELSDLDTMNLWKLGGWRTNTSLEAICAVLGIACKSEEVSGSNLWEYSINEVPMDELALYCDEDVESCYKMVKHISNYINIWQ